MAGETFLPNFNMASMNPNYGFSQQSNLAFNMPQQMTGMSPDALRFAQLNNQMQPNSFLPYIGAGVQGINTLGNLFLGFQGMRAAQQDAAWQRGMAENNYWNSVKSFNSSVEDRITGRYSPTTVARNKDAIDSEIKSRQIGGG